MANRLRHALSPYLRQHADNPVDWHEWGEDAFAEARRRDVPVLLSVGYAACHWCHVMAHESFEDQEVANALAKGYVAVKVDREERPDIDAVYMAATVALTGHGGWPMTCLLTPDADPFFAGTYLPKDQLLRLLSQADELWRTRRDDLETSGRTITEKLREATATPASAQIGPDELSAAVTGLRRSFDPVRGGFGRSPKFPPSMLLEMLARHTARTGSAQAAEMLDATLAAMAAGGIHDQLAGGFARYAVDAAWVVPHFEKMLYDNALLARVYGHRAAVTGDARQRQVALGAAEFIIRDLGTPEGGFAAALDADTFVDGALHEGATYVWTPQQLTAVLGPQDGARAADLLSVTADGTFEHGSSTLQLLSAPPDAAWWEGARQRLLAARRQRSQPARDDKVVTAWAGLAIAALSELAVLFGRPGLLHDARTCAELLLGTHVVDGRLRRTSLAGQVSGAPAVLADYGNLAEGLVALHLATGEARWLHEARTLVDLAVAHFWDDDAGWQDTADDAEPLVLRPHEEGDNAEPSGRSAIAGALLAYAMASGSADHLELARGAVEAAGKSAVTQPRFAGWTLAVAEALAAGPLQVAVVGEGAARDELADLARALTAGRGVVAVGRPDDPDQPLLADRPLPEGARAAAYLCVGTTCSLPLTDPAALRAALQAVVAG